MQPEILLKHEQFLTGGGETGALIRSKDWTNSALGDIAQWPQSLRTALNMILNSRFPMFLLWGPELNFFYNDAYRPSLGDNGKHPDILGESAEIAWAEIWLIIKPLLEKVRKGESTWSEDQLMPVFRNGTIEEIYLTSSYSPIYDEEGKVNGILCTCVETTQKVLNEKLTKNNEQKFRNLIQEAPVAISTYRGPDYIMEQANDAALRLWGKDNSIIGKKLLDIFPELRNQSYMQILDQVYETGITYEGKENLAFLDKNGKLTPTYLTFIYKALHDSEKNVTGILCMGYDVTEHVESRKKAIEAEERTRLAIESAMLGTFDKDMVTNQAVYSKRFYEIFGLEEGVAIQEDFFNAIHPDDLHIRNEATDLMMKTGTANFQIRIIRPDSSIRWVNTFGKIFFNEQKIPVRYFGMCNDITDQISSKRNMEILEERSRIAIETAQLGTFDINVHTMEYIFSTRMREIFGFDTSVNTPLTENDIVKVIHPDDLHIRNNANLQALQTGSINYELRLLMPDGSIRWIITLGKLFYNEGKVTRVIGAVKDITEEKEVEEKLSRLAAIVMSSEDAIVSKRLDGYITSWNNSAERIFGYTEEEMIGRHITTIIPKERIKEEEEIIEKLKRGERVEHFETRRITKDGREIDLSLSISPIKDFNGKVIGASKIARDITQQKEAEKLLHENEERLNVVVKASDLGTWELSLKDGSVWYSKRYLQIMGFDEHEHPTHEHLINRIHPEDLGIRKKALDESIQSGVLSYSGRVIWPDHSIHWFEARGEVFYDENRNSIKMIGTIRDITEEKSYQNELEKKVQERTKELQQANKGLEKMNQELASFAYVSSHDLQEPLRKIQTFAARIVEKETLSEIGKDYFSRMQSAAKRMQQLIEDLLAYSRTNTTERIFEHINLNSILFDVKNELDQAILEKHAVIDSDDLPEANIIPYQFRQLFTNIISNSLKFSRKDVPLTIEIRSRKIKGTEVPFQTTDPTRYYHHISISDNGIGFEPEYSERIFEVFQRLHGRSEYEGTGIGLAIAKKIMDNHHGFISAHGIPDKGATFNLFFPV